MLYPFFFQKKLGTYFTYQWESSAHGMGNTFRDESGVIVGYAVPHRNITTFLDPSGKVLGYGESDWAANNHKTIYHLEPDNGIKFHSVSCNKHGNDSDIELYHESHLLSIYHQKYLGGNTTESKVEYTSYTLSLLENNKRPEDDIPIRRQHI